MEGPRKTAPTHPYTNDNPANMIPPPHGRHGTRSSCKTSRKAITASLMSPPLQPIGNVPPGLALSALGRQMMLDEQCSASLRVGCVYDRAGPGAIGNAGTSCRASPSFSVRSAASLNQAWAMSTDLASDYDKLADRAKERTRAPTFGPSPIRG
jgi:hypothetical protein